MAKRTRNTAIEQTYLKHPFHQESLSQTGYKQLKYEDSATVAADDPGHDYQQHQNVSSPVLATVTATVPNSPINSPTNPFTASYTQVSGNSYRNGANSYRSNGNISQVSGHVVSSPLTTPGAGHYAANLTGTTLTPNTSGKQKQILLDLSRASGYLQASPAEMANESPLVQLLSTPRQSAASSGVSCSSWACHGIRDLLASLALMCVLSLFMAFLAMFFLHKSNALSVLGEDSLSSSVNNSRWQQRLMASTLHQRLVSNAKEYMRVFQISICLSTLTIALDLCCLFVCCIQFLSIVKLIKTPFGKKRSLEFIKKTSSIRILAIGCFLVSIPIFFTGVILFTFVNFEEIPALITSIFIGVAIIFCGIASVQNVYLWQWEKTKASEDLRLSQQAATFPSGQHLAYGQATTSNYPTELSTLV